MLLPLDASDVQLATDSDLLSLAYDERLRSYVPQHEFNDMVKVVNGRILQKKKLIWIAAAAIAFGVVLGFTGLIVQIEIAASVHIECPGNCFWIYVLAAVSILAGLLLRPYYMHKEIMERDAAFRDMIASGNEKFLLTQWRFEADRVPFVASQLCGLYTTMGMMPAVIVRRHTALLDENNQVQALAVATATAAAASLDATSSSSSSSFSDTKESSSFSSFSSSMSPRQSKAKPAPVPLTDRVSISINDDEETKRDDVTIPLLKQ